MVPLCAPSLEFDVRRDGLHRPVYAAPFRVEWAESLPHSFPPAVAIHPSDIFGFLPRHLTPEILKCDVCEGGPQ